MALDSDDRLTQLCRDLAVRLTERPSVTGTEDEASFGPWLAELLRGLGVFGGAPEVWSLPVAEGDGRHCVAMLVRRSGAATVLLTGHYDTVTVADYGDLAPLATRPAALAAALADRVRDTRSSARPRGAAGRTWPRGGSCRGAGFWT